MADHLLIYGIAAVAVLLAALLLLRRAGLSGAPAAGSRFKEFGRDIRLRDLFRLAVMVEEKGGEFYLRMAAKSLRPETKELCARLAAEEAAHRQLFLGKLATWPRLGVNPHTWPAFIEKVRQEGFFDNAPGEDASEDQLAAYAIRQEIKTAEFYGLFEKAFPKEWKRAHIRELVLEERSHEARLRAAYPHLR